MIRIEYSFEKMKILREKQLISERYTCSKIGAHGIHIRGEVGAHVFCFWMLVTKVKCVKCSPIENTKKTASTQVLIYIYTFKCCWTFLLTFFLRFYVTWEAM